MNLLFNKPEYDVDDLHRVLTHLFMRLNNSGQVEMISAKFPAEHVV